MAIRAPSQDSLPVGADFRSHEQHRRSDRAPPQSNSQHAENYLAWITRQEATARMSGRTDNDQPVSELRQPLHGERLFRPSKEIYLATSLCLASVVLTTIGVTLLAEDAANGGAANPRHLVILLFGLLATVATSWRTYIVWQQRRAKRRQVTEGVRLEAERWRIIIREKDREVRKAGEVALRLRGSLRSVSLERRSMRSASKVQENGAQTSDVTGPRGRNMEKRRDNHVSAEDEIMAVTQKKSLEEDIEAHLKDVMAYRPALHREGRPSPEFSLAAPGNLMGLERHKLDSQTGMPDPRILEPKTEISHGGKGKGKAPISESAYVSNYPSTVDMPHYQSPPWLTSREPQSDPSLTYPVSEDANLEKGQEAKSKSKSGRQPRTALARERSSGLLSITSSLGLPPTTIRGGLYSHPISHARTDAVDLRNRDSRTWHGELMEVPLGRVSMDQASGDRSNDGREQINPPHQESPQVVKYAADPSLTKALPALPELAKLSPSLERQSTPLSRQPSGWTHHLDLVASSSVRSLPLSSLSHSKSLTPAPLFSLSPPLKNPLRQTPQADRPTPSSFLPRGDSSVVPIITAYHDQVMPIPRGNHGQMGSMQSDDNIAVNGALPSDAESADDRMKALRIENVERRVGSWVAGTMPRNGERPRRSAKANRILGLGDDGRGNSPEEDGVELKAWDFGPPVRQTDDGGGEESGGPRSPTGTARESGFVRHVWNKRKSIGMPMGLGLGAGAGTDPTTGEKGKWRVW